MNNCVAIVLAAGQGKRMHSSLPKVMQPVAGRPLVYYPITAAMQAGVEHVVVVVGHGREQVEPYLKETFGDRVQTVVQQEQLGTGHAAMQALPVLGEDVDGALVLYGDTPLLRHEDLSAALEALDQGTEAPLAMLVCTVDEPAGYGRILRDGHGRVESIREDRDLAPEQRSIREVNPGIYAVRVGFLREALGRIGRDNAQGEMYLTDIVAMAAEQGGVVDVPADASALVGVNDRAQLDEAEQKLLERIRRSWQRQGVTIRGDAVVEDTVTLEPEAVLEPHVVLRGSTHVQRGATIDVGCVVTNSTIGAGALLKPYSVVTDSRVGEQAQIGPFAHLRPGSDVGPEAHVGNFVETKKTVLHRGAKANHLAYLGDGEIGEKANVGAGTIFCNYDGFQKHKTIIGAGAFIGSDSQLVAPVTVGDGAYVGTGSTVTRDVPADALAIARARQVNKEGYAPKLRARLEAAARKAKQKKET